MGGSLNRVAESDGCYTKCYGPKRPLLNYYLRSFLNQLGVRQPVEYYANKKRQQFEQKVLSLWLHYGLKVPEVLEVADGLTRMAKIDGPTLAELHNSESMMPDNMLAELFEDVNQRHSMALKNEQPLLCHVDANLRNMIASDHGLYHIDFEMGREHEPVTKWMEREVTKLLISLLKPLDKAGRLWVLACFVDHYSHKSIIKSIIDSQSGKNPKPGYSLRNIADELSMTIGSAS